MFLLYKRPLELAFDKKKKKNVSKKKLAFDFANI